MSIFKHYEIISNTICTFKPKKGGLIVFFLFSNKAKLYFDVVEL